MNILIAPDSFKGTLTSLEVCDIVESAIRKRIDNCNITKLPVADGGEGLCSSLHSAIGGTKVYAECKDPFGQPMMSEYVILKNKTAVIEMASCAGLPLAGTSANPLITTTYGVGMLIADAQRHQDVEHIILGLGGSATNDCGIGMAEALGFRFLDCDGNAVKTIGKNMINISRIIRPKNLSLIDITAACDVTNPLFGENGAACVFAPQKGANKDEVKELDYGLRHISQIIKSDIGTEVSDIPGAGAAGGLGAGAVAFLGAELKSGINIVLDELNFDMLLDNTDLVITGEGKLDYQSAHGKVISGVCTRAKKRNIPIVAICGCSDGTADLKDLGINKLFVSTEFGTPFETVKRTCRDKLYESAMFLAKDIYTSEF